MIKFLLTMLGASLIMSLPLNPYLSGTLCALLFLFYTYMGRDKKQQKEREQFDEYI